MPKPVISVENLFKSYRLGQIGTGTFSRDLEVWWARARGKPNPLLKIGQTDHGNQAGETIWALKDVSFSVEQGEVLGIIGRNGAGKSTLLKILSRVTAPTSGRVKVKGRIASLLEVGTGFHPELTGRENIYLNGAILGMTKEEVKRKFDEIVAFAEIEKFIDTPVKRYSSGMYVRLAFAVAAHLDSEILLVDEVLAVGDAEFQKKCLGKMGDVASKEGRTVFFVSHNMGAIRQLSRRVVLLQEGQISTSGEVDEVINSYLRYNPSKAISSKYLVKDEIIRDQPNYIEQVEVTDLKGNQVKTIGISEPFLIKIWTKTKNVSDKLVFGVEISSISGNKVLNIRSDSENQLLERNGFNSNLCIIRVPGLDLYPNIYYLSPWFAEYRGNRLDQVNENLSISLISKGYLRAEGLIQDNRGIVLMDCDWIWKNVE